MPLQGSHFSTLFQPEQLLSQLWQSPVCRAGRMEGILLQLVKITSDKAHGLSMGIQGSTGNNRVDLGRKEENFWDEGGETVTQVALREAGDAAFPETFQAGLDGDLSNLVWQKVSLCPGVDELQDPFQPDPFCHSMLL